MTSEDHSGGCICGAVRFVARGPSFRIAACHCQYCQKASSSAFQVFAFFRKKQVTVNGEQNLTRYAERSPAHGRTVPTEFCRICGTRVAAYVETAPSMRLIHAGSFDNRSFIEIKEHQFVRHAVWRSFPANVRLFLDSIQRPDSKMNEPLPIQSKPFVLEHSESPPPAKHREKWQGGCLCGAVRYSASRAPRRTVSCNCEFCYRYAFRRISSLCDSDCACVLSGTPGPR
jgi:hypothetical protein